MNHFDYIHWFVFFAWLPIAIVWLLDWRTLIQYKKVIFFCIVGSIIFATPWDYWATHYWLWHFSPDHILNTYFLGIPLEEYIFFVSYAVLYSSVALSLWHKQKTKA